MTMKRRPRPQWRRRITALLAAGATASSDSFSAAWEALGRRSALALPLLESQLGGVWTGGVLPVRTALAIGQSPVLLSSQDK